MSHVVQKRERRRPNKLCASPLWRPCPATCAGYSILRECLCACSTAKNSTADVTAAAPTRIRSAESATWGIVLPTRVNATAWLHPSKRMRKDKSRWLYHLLGALWPCPLVPQQFHQQGKDQQLCHPWVIWSKLNDSYQTCMSYPRFWSDQRPWMRTTPRPSAWFLRVLPFSENRLPACTRGHWMQSKSSWWDFSQAQCWRHQIQRPSYPTPR